MSKVVHIITGLSDGGAEAVLFRLATFDQQHRHIVISLGDMGKYGQLLEERGVRVHCLNMPRGRVSVKGMLKLFAIIRREQPQLVQTWMYHANLLGGIAARLNGVKDVFWGIHHTRLVPGTTGASTRIVDWLCARLSHFVPKAIVACAHEAMRVHVANGYDGKKFTVIPNGYDVSLFVPDPAGGTRVRQELGIASDARVVGLVGRWDPQKDHANLVAAVRVVKDSYPQLNLVLAGTACDADNSDLTGLLHAAGLYQGVHLLGRRSDIPALMNALDIHVLSSYNEAFPNVVAEAMACGTPCIVTEVGDTSEIIGETGWSVPPKNYQALAAAIDRALQECDDQARWATRQASARQRIVNEFGLRAMAERYNEAWSL